MMNRETLTKHEISFNRIFNNLRKIDKSCYWIEERTKNTEYETSKASNVFRFNSSDENLF